MSKKRTQPMRNEVVQTTRHARNIVDDLNSGIYMALRRNITALSCRLSTTANSGRTPWFLSSDEPCPVSVPPVQPTSPLPKDVPSHLRKLYSELSMSPYLEASSLMVTRPTMPMPSSPLPFMRRKGSRRKRGGTDSGFGIDMPDNDLWSWFVLAQVRVHPTFQYMLNVPRLRKAQKGGVP